MNWTRTILDGLAMAAYFIYALWTRCPSTGWVGCSTVPKRWLPAVTAVTFISAKRVPVGTKNGRENRKRKI